MSPRTNRVLPNFCIVSQTKPSKLSQSVPIEVQCEDGWFPAKLIMGVRLLCNLSLKESALTVNPVLSPLLC